ncbi:MAG: hypothetical protein ACO1OB_13090, partial [Archangium sp.]
VRDVGDAQLFFTVPADVTEVLLRVSGPPTSQGDYVLRMLRLGVDDFPNTAASAPLHAGTLEGDLGYSQDVDVVRLQLPALTDVLLIAHPGDVIFELQRADGGVRLLDTEAIHVTVPVAEALLVTARARDNVSTGAFQLEVSLNGPDDHATDSFFATQFAWNGTLYGRFDRDLDVDTFIAPQMPAHIYALHFDNVDRGRVVVVDAQGMVIDESSYPRGVVSWEAVSNQPVDLAVNYFGENRPDGGGPTYRVDVEDLGLDDFGDTRATASPITLPASINGIAAPESDVDVVSFVVAAGRIIEVTTTAQFTLTDAAGQSVPGLRGQEPVLMTTAGTYFVSLNTTWWDLPLRYQLTVRDLGVDDHGGPTSATPMQVGVPVTGAVQFTGDTDAFSFPTVNRHVYEVTCTGTGCALSENGPQRVVVVGDGTSHTVVVSANTVPASFSLQVTELGVEDHGSTQATATPLSFDVPTNGEFLWSSDVDLFSFPMVAGRSYAVFVADAELYPSVLDGAGTSLGIFGHQPGAPRTASFVAPSTGTAFVSVYGGTSAYWVRVSDLTVDDHGDTFATGTASTPGNVMAVVASSSDADVFTLTTGLRFYTATVGALCRVSIIDAGDAVLATGTNVTVKGDGAPIGFRVTSTFSPQLCSLSLQESAVDDHGDTAATATPLTWDAGVVGSFQHATDVDVFSLPVAVGEIAVVEMTSGLMELISPTGVMIPFGNLGAVRATQTGVWTVRVLNVNGNQPSPWTITAHTTVDDFGDTEATATPYVLGTTQTGVLQHYDDVDYFSVTLQAGVDYGIERQAGPTQTWPYLSFFQAGIPVNPQPGVAPGTFRFPVTGTYFVRVARGQGWTPAPWSWRLF